MNILGINAYHGDASAALFVDGQLVAAVEEERFTRVKHDTSFPHQAIRYCLETRGHRDPRTSTTSRCPATRGRTSGSASPTRSRTGPAARSPRRRVANLRKILRAKQTLADGLGVAGRATEGQAPLRRAPPGTHRSSYYVSPFERAAVLSHRRLRRHDQRDVGRRRGRSPQDPRRGRVPPLARRLLHGGHAVPRLPEVRRRVQGDGPRLATASPTTWTSSARSCTAPASATT